MILGPLRKESPTFGTALGFLTSARYDFVVPTALLDPVDSETIQQLRSEVPGAPVLPKPVLRNGQAMGLSLLPTNKLHHRFIVGS